MRPRGWTRAALASVLLVGLACASGEAPPPPAPSAPEAWAPAAPSAPAPAPAPAAPAPAPAEPPPSGSLAELARSLNLEPEHVAALAKYDTLLASSRKGTQAACAVASGAQTLAGALQGKAMDELALQGRLDELDEPLVGVGLGSEEGQAYTWTAYSELAHVLDPKAAPLLKADDLLGTPQPWVQYQDAVGYCTNLKPVTPSVKALTSAWPGGPPCLQEMLRPLLQEALEELQRESCFCAAKEEVEKELAALRAALAALAKAGGPAGTAPELGPEARFGGGCGG
jgi:hypothetical protein